MYICQKYAAKNREIIAKTILKHYFDMNLVHLVVWDCQKQYNEFGAFETIHNYISPKDNIFRKGAISAYKDERVLIPINMRDGCILGIGKGNEDWNCSAPHGAGRLMSRSKAKESISLDEFKESMNGIYTTSVNTSTIDESPMAYKPIESILDNIGDTVEIEKILKPIYNFKASE